MWDRLSNEPVLVTNAIAALIAVVVALGVPVSVELKVAILGFAAALLLLIPVIRARTFGPRTVAALDTEDEDRRKAIKSPALELEESTTRKYGQYPGGRV